MVLNQLPLKKGEKSMNLTTPLSFKKKKNHHFNIDLKKKKNKPAITCKKRGLPEWQRERERERAPTSIELRENI